MPYIDTHTLRRLLEKNPSVGYESTCVESFDYNPETEELTVSHPGAYPGKGGRGTWVYEGVPVSVYTDFAQASSQGTYFNLYIKGQYSYRRED
jgi:hypothetical protein